MQNDYKGFALFNDVQDGVLRTTNRAVVLANIAEDHSKNRLISAKGTGLIMGYFMAVPIDERRGVQEAFVSEMKNRNFILTKNEE